MTSVSTVFWDVGGVLGTNGWDRAGRRRAAEQFQLDWEEFQDRHELVSDAFETGKISLAEYLRCTVFHDDRPFSPADFQAFMFEQSQPNRTTLDVASRIAQTGRYLLCTLNNESFELNQHRIERFRLRESFSLFLSSCFLGVKKPDETIYRLALRVTQQEPERCVFIDDRPLNVDAARALDLKAIHYRNPEQLARELSAQGVTSR